MPLCAGAGMVIHVFGAYLGLTAARFVSKGAAGHRDEVLLSFGSILDGRTIFLLVM